MKQIEEVLAISTRALADLAIALPRIKASMATCSTRLQDFVAAKQQLLQERDLLLQLAVLHEATPKAKAIAAGDKGRR